MTTITVYGAEGCKDTARAVAHLRSLGVDFTYVDVDRAEGALAKVRGYNSGGRKTPTVVFDGEGANGCQVVDVLPVPGNTELDAHLGRHLLLPLSESGDGSPGLT